MDRYLVGDMECCCFDIVSMKVGEVTPREGRLNDADPDYTYICRFSKEMETAEVEWTSPRVEQSVFTSCANP